MGNGSPTKKQRLRELNNNWRGGRSLASNGYVLVRVGIGHHLADVRGYAYEHRLVAEQKTGRWLLPNEHVHHIDGNKQNNKPDNLEVLTSSQHRFQHRLKSSGRKLPDEVNWIRPCNCGCGQSFYRYDENGRPRDYIAGHNMRFTAKPTVEALICLLAKGYATREELIAKSGLTKSAVACCLTKLKQRGVVVQVRHGIWRLKDV